MTAQRPEVVVVVAPSSLLRGRTGIVTERLVDALGRPHAMVLLDGDERELLFGEDALEAVEPRD